MCVELLIERCNIMTSSRVLAVRCGTGQSNPYTEASSTSKTDLTSDVNPLQFRNQKRCEVFELLMEPIEKNDLLPRVGYPLWHGSKQFIPRGELPLPIIGPTTAAPNANARARALARARAPAPAPAPARAGAQFENRLSQGKRNGVGDVGRLSEYRINFM